MLRYSADNNSSDSFYYRALRRVSNRSPLSSEIGGRPIKFEDIQKIIPEYIYAKSSVHHPTPKELRRAFYQYIDEEGEDVRASVEDIDMGAPANHYIQRQLLTERLRNIDNLPVELWDYSKLDNDFFDVRVRYVGGATISPSSRWFRGGCYLGDLGGWVEAIRDCKLIARRSTQKKEISSEGYSNVVLPTENEIPVINDENGIVTELHELQFESFQRVHTMNWVDGTCSDIYYTFSSNIYQNEFCFMRPHVQMGLKVHTPNCVIRQVWHNDEYPSLGVFTLHGVTIKYGDELICDYGEAWYENIAFRAPRVAAYLEAVFRQSAKLMGELSPHFRLPRAFLLLNNPRALGRKYNIEVSDIYEEKPSETARMSSSEEENIGDENERGNVATAAAAAAAAGGEFGGIPEGEEQGSGICREEGMAETMVGPNTSNTSSDTNRQSSDSCGKAAPDAGSGVEEEGGDSNSNLPWDNVVSSCMKPKTMLGVYNKYKDSSDNVYRNSDKDMGGKVTVYISDCNGNNSGISSSEEDDYVEILEPVQETTTNTDNGNDISNRNICNATPYVPFTSPPQNLLRRSTRLPRTVSRRRPSRATGGGGLPPSAARLLERLRSNINIQ